MTNLSLVKQHAKEHGITLPQLLDLLRPEVFDAIDAKVRVMRESFMCPYVVKDYDEFKEQIFAFWAHSHKCFFNADYAKTGLPMPGLIRNQAYQFVEQHLGGYQELLRAERNSIAGREGGMIAVIDTMTEALVKQQTELYIRSVFFELIEPGDYETRLRLAEELLKTYGPFLFPGERLLPHYIIGANLETFIQGFATQLMGIRKQWRR
jgi:hypothetical protein